LSAVQEFGRLPWLAFFFRRSRRFRALLPITLTSASALVDVAGELNRVGSEGDQRPGERGDAAYRLFGEINAVSNPGPGFSTQRHNLVCGNVRPRGLRGRNARNLARGIEALGPISEVKFATSQ
jgi:hypothetical protein